MTRVHLQKNRRCGAALVEVLLAAAMIAILAIVAATALMYSTRLSVSSARRQIALQEAGKMMEETVTTNSVITGKNYSIVALDERLNISRTVVSVSGEKQITVRVTDTTGNLLVELITARTL